MTKMTFDTSTCTRCGLCVDVCPNRIPRFDASNSVYADPLRVEACFRCGHCMAICPTESVVVSGLNYGKDFFPLPEVKIEPKPFYDLISTRRAVRNFTDREVEAEKLEDIVNAISFSPPGFPPLKFELIVVNSKTVMKESLPLMVDLYDSLLKALGNPIKRHFIKREVGKRRFLTMQRHLVPSLKRSLPGLREGSEDTITRGAPAMILLLSRKGEEEISADIHIAAAYGMLSAHSLGLGASIMDIIPPAINNKRELRALFGLRDDQEVVSSIIVGYPRHRFQRGISRKMKSVQWVG